MGTEADVARLMAPQLELLLPHLDERSRRLVLGSVALAAGQGGVTAVAQVSGAAWQTVADGAAELESGTVVQGRVRRPGAGRKRRRRRTRIWCRRCWRWWRTARAGIRSRR